MTVNRSVRASPDRTRTHVGMGRLGLHPSVNRGISAVAGPDDAPAVVDAGAPVHPPWRIGTVGAPDPA